MHAFTLAYVHTYIHTCIHSYMHNCLLAYSHTRILAYLHTYILAYLHTYILACLHTSILAYLHTCILAYLHTCILAYLLTRLVSRQAGSSYPETFWSVSETQTLAIPIGARVPKKHVYFCCYKISQDFMHEWTLPLIRTPSYDCANDYSRTWWGYSCLKLAFF